MRERGTEFLAPLKTLLIALLFLALVLGFKYTHRSQNPDRISEATSFFSESLRKANVKESVVLKGHHYKVERGEVSSDDSPINPVNTLEALRIAYALVLARRNPLLSLEGTDPQNLSEAINELADAAAELVDVQKTSLEAIAVSSNLFPLTFLRTLAETENARQKFLVIGDEKDGEKYEQLLSDAFRAYRNGLERYAIAFDAFVPSQISNYRIVTGTVSREGIETAIANLKDGILKKESEFTERSLCLSGEIASCNSSEIKIPRVVVPAKYTKDQENTSYVSEILSIYKDAHVSIHAPAVELSQSSCVSGISLPYAFVLGNKSGGSESTRPLLFIGDILMIETRKQPGVPFYKFFADHDVDYWPYFPTNTYTCPAVAGDYGSVLATFAIVDTVLQNPFSVFASGQAQFLLRSLEERLKNSTIIVREVDALQYLSEALNALEDMPDTPEEVLNRLARLSVMAKNKSAGLEGIVNRLAEEEIRSDLALKSQGVPAQMDARSLFYIKSGFFSLFLGNNVSAVGPQIGPIETGATSLPDDVFLRYSNARGRISRNVFVKSIDYLVRIHNDATLIDSKK